MLPYEVMAFNLPRTVSVYSDRTGYRWWTKAWFNNHEKGEPAVEIDLGEAIRFLVDRPDRDEWLEKYYPDEMKIIREIIETTTNQLIQNPTK